MRIVFYAHRAFILQHNTVNRIGIQYHFIRKKSRLLCRYLCRWGIIKISLGFPTLWTHPQFASYRRADRDTLDENVTAFSNPIVMVFCYAVCFRP